MKPDSPYFFACPRCSSRASFTHAPRPRADIELEYARMGKVYLFIFLMMMSLNLLRVGFSIEYGFNQALERWQATINLLIWAFIYWIVVRLETNHRYVHCDACGHFFCHPPLPQSAERNRWHSRFIVLGRLTLIFPVVYMVAVWLEVPLRSAWIVPVTVSLLTASLGCRAMAWRFAVRDRREIAREHRIKPRPLPSAAELAQRAYARDQSVEADFYFSCPRCASRRSFSKHTLGSFKGGWLKVYFFMALAGIWMLPSVQWLGGIALALMAILFLAGFLLPRIRCNACRHTFPQPLFPASRVTMRWRAYVVLCLVLVIGLIVLAPVAIASGAGRMAVLFVPLIFAVAVSALVCYSKSQEFREQDVAELSKQYRVIAPEDILFEQPSSSSQLAVKHVTT